MIEDDIEDKSWLDAEERAREAFEAVLSNGTKIQGDHHLIFHTRMSFTCMFSPERLTEARRLRVWKATCLPR